jgi:hypothetical protein
MANSGSTTRRGGYATFALRATARPQRHGRAIAKRRREDPGAAHARQHTSAFETEGGMDFGGGLWSAQVRRVSPRPQDRGGSWTLFGREPLPESGALGLAGPWVAGDPAVSERPPYLPARSTDRHLKLARVSSGSAAAGSRGWEVCMSDCQATVQLTR